MAVISSEKTTAPLEMLGPEPPETVSAARQIHRWASISFVHWSYEPDIVQALLPPGLTVDTFDGSQNESLGTPI